MGPRQSNLKKNGDSYTGSYQVGNNSPVRNQNIPHIGKYIIVSAGCDRPQIIEGAFSPNNSPYGLKPTFSFKLKSNEIQVDFNRLSGSNSSLDVTLRGGIKVTLSDPHLEFDADDRLVNLRSKEHFLGYNGGLGEIGLYSMEWAKVFDCSSSPDLKLQRSMLAQTSSRFVIHDVGVNLSKLKSWGFVKTTNVNTPHKGQLFIAKILDFSPERKVTRSYQQSSSCVSSSYQRRNPAYDVARMEMDKAARDLSVEESEVSAFSANCTGSFWECVLAEALIDGTNQLEQNLESKKRNLSSTPSTVTEKIYSDYSVTKLDITALKSGSVVIALIDFDRGITYLDELPFNEKKKFTVINSAIHPSDRNTASLKRGSSSEQEVDRWMKTQPKLDEDLTSLLVKLVNSGDPQRVQTDTQISQAMNWAQGKRISRLDNIAETRDSDNEFSAANVVGGLQKWYDDFGDEQEPKQTLAKSKSRPGNYNLEDSIVVVETLKGAGSGFYISPRQVLTNAHVVGDSEFVQMRDFNGKQTTGKVIKKDLGSDLALVSVSRAGIPLQFSKGCKVNRREEVFTIGHPKGYEYSTTRGIVSSIRNMENPFVRAAGKYSYVQVDAPISEGNSGAPLFNSSEKVIGVNTFTRSDGQNLNFAVHCEEIMQFLDSGRP